jgi:hypothetical protein
MVDGTTKAARQEIGKARRAATRKRTIANLPEAVDPQQVLAKVRDVTSRCIEQGRMQHATVCVGTSSYAIGPRSPQNLASLAA